MFWTWSWMHYSTEVVIKLPFILKDMASLDYNHKQFLYLNKGVLFFILPHITLLYPCSSTYSIVLWLMLNYLFSPFIPMLSDNSWVSNIFQNSSQNGLLNRWKFPSTWNLMVLCTSSFGKLKILQWITYEYKLILSKNHKEIGKTY